MKPTDDEIRATYRETNFDVFETVDYFIEKHCVVDGLTAIEWAQMYTKIIKHQANETIGDMLTFEELLDKCDPSDLEKERLFWCFNVARQGMRPAKNAITLPDEDKWPEWAQGIRIKYQGTKLDHYQIIEDVLRTKPQPIKMSKAEALERLAGVMGRDVEIVE